MAQSVATPPSAWGARGGPSPYACSFHRLRSTEATAHPSKATSDSPKTLAKEIHAGNIPISTSRPSVEYSAIISSDQEARTISCIVFYKEDLSPVLDAYDPVKTAEFVEMKRKLKVLEDEAEARKKAESRYELASRTLAAFDDFLWAGVDDNKQNGLWNKYRIKHFAAIRQGHKEWQQRLDFANDHDRPLPVPSDYDLAVKEVWTMAHVKPHWPLIRTLQKEKSNTGVVRNPSAHPAPARDEFLAYAKELQLPDDLRDILADRKHRIQGELELYFTP